MVLLLWAVGSVVSRIAGGFDSPLSTFSIDHRSGWLTVVMTAATDLGSIVAAIVVAAVAIVLLLRARAPRSAVAVAVALGGELVIEYSTKMLVGRVRPQGHHLVVATSQSFPSGHAMYAAAFFGILIVLALRDTPRPSWARPAAVLLAVLTLLVGMSRVYLGVHWPTDVMGGWSFGAAWAAVVAHVVIPRREVVRLARLS